MSTNGAVNIISESRKLGIYNHSDSYPTWLGVRALKLAYWAAEAPTRVAGLVRNVRLVKDEDEPTDAEREQYAEYWQDVDSGRSWYACLRGLQGNVADSLKLGVIVAQDKVLHAGGWLAWTYTLDLVAGTFIVEDGEHTTVFPLADLPANDTDFLERVPDSY